jgi:uncharacterized protein (TIGR03085 family)
MTWHTHERAALAEALAAAGPHAPTLCAGWEARHLAAHVVLREHSARVGAGLVVPALASQADRAIERLADTAQDDEGFADLVARVGTPLPAWNPMSWAGDAANLIEFFVHAEDVRRGAGPVPARDLTPGREQALWNRLVKMAPLAYRRAPTGIVLVVPGGRRHVVRGTRGGRGSVAVSGQVGELALHALGRGAAADVTLLGSPDDIAALQSVIPGG